jgi:hypothetical protein
MEWFYRQTPAGHLRTGLCASPRASLPYRALHAFTFASREAAPDPFTLFIPKA